MYTVTSAARIRSGSLRQRCDEGLSRALKGGLHRYRSRHLLLDFSDCIDSFAQRGSRRKIEGDGGGGKLSNVADQDRLGRAARVCECASGTAPPRGRLDVDILQVSRMGLELRLHFEDHVILVQLGKKVDTWRCPKAS